MGIEKRFLSLYYLSNVAAVCTYLLLREFYENNRYNLNSKFNSMDEFKKMVSQPLRCLRRRCQGRQCHRLGGQPDKYLNVVFHVFSSQEQQASTLLGIMISLKYFRRQSLDGFFSDAFLFSKSVLLLLAWYMDWRIACIYAALFLGACMSNTPTECARTFVMYVCSAV